MPVEYWVASLRCSFQLFSLKLSCMSILIVAFAGLFNHINSEDLLKISILACFCAIHNHGLQALISLSTTVQHAPCPPIGFRIFRADVLTSILVSVYSPSFSENQGASGIILSYFIIIDDSVFPSKFTPHIMLNGILFCLIFQRRR